MLICGQDVTRYLHNFNKRHCLSVTHLRADRTFSFQAVIDLQKEPFHFTTECCGIPMYT
jgi:hypothetical protein